MPEREACEIILQLAEAIDYCHNQGIIHRDIKFQNILLAHEISELPLEDQSSGIKIKVVDFGIFGSNRGKWSEKSTAGSLKYMAPELLSGRTYSTPKIDIWSMGCVLYAMLTGEHPFTSSEREDLKHQIINRSVNFSPSKTAHLSPDCVQILE